MLVAHGLDLGGFSTGSSRLVKVSLESAARVVRAEVVDASPWARSLAGEDDVAVDRSDARARFGAELPLAVDVPLDLQDLPALFAAGGPEPHAEFQWVWQYTLRPIDYALRALPPLADRLGAAVSRWRALAPVGWQAANQDDRLLETYPAACLRFSRLPHEGYKQGTAQFANGAWVARSNRGGAPPPRASHPLAQILTGMRVTQVDDPGEHGFTDDDVDALICALAALAAQAGEAAQGDALWQWVLEQAAEADRELPDGNAPPTGYTLLDLTRKACWDEIHLS